MGNKLSADEKAFLNGYWLWTSGSISSRKFFSFLRDLKKLFHGGGLSERT